MTKGLNKLALLLVAIGGCGLLTNARTLFPQHVADAQGDPVYVQDLRAIIDDSDLSNEEKADALRDLGLENEEIIETLIADGLDGSAGGADGLPSSGDVP